MKLPYSVSIVVPSTIGLDEPIDNSEYVEDIAYSLSKLFGGCDRIEGKGYYIANNEQLIVEDTIKLVSRCESLSDDEVEQVVKIALDLKAEMKQEAIMYYINDIAYIE